MCIVTLKTMVWNKSYGERRENVVKNDRKEGRKKERKKERKNSNKEKTLPNCARN